MSQLRAQTGIADYVDPLADVEPLVRALESLLETANPDEPLAREALAAWRIKHPEAGFRKPTLTAAYDALHEDLSREATADEPGKDSHA